ncbi:MAG: hypothetical protein JSS76_08025 [Bacteroidetes bacterium]|nr:hypothetical protein [Bacteroidota bacterium]
MRHTLHLTIPMPCHERWDAMTATERGAFCHSCQKEVIDFSSMTDSELLSFFAGGKATCGRFRGDQVGVRIMERRLDNGRMKWRALFFSLLPFLSLKTSAAAPDQYRMDLTAENISAKPQLLPSHAPPQPLITKLAQETLKMDNTIILQSEDTATTSHEHWILGAAAVGEELVNYTMPHADYRRKDHQTQFLSPKKERKHWLRRFLRLG